MHRSSNYCNRKQSKTVLNKYAGRFWCKRTTGDGLYHCRKLLLWIFCPEVIFISHSDGTHSLQIYWWSNKAMLNFSKPVPMKKRTPLQHCGLDFQKLLFLGELLTIFHMLNLEESVESVWKPAVWICAHDLPLFAISISSTVNCKWKTDGISEYIRCWIMHCEFSKPVINIYGALGGQSVRSSEILRQHSNFKTFDVERKTERNTSLWAFRQYGLFHSDTTGDVTKLF